MSVEAWKGYMRGFGEGPDFPSRESTANVLKALGAMDVLDVGCGGGIEYESLKKRGVDIIYWGVDYSENAIKACKEMFPEADFEVGDARGLRFPDSAFDVVMVRHCLEHVDDWRKVISEAFRVARKAVILILWVEPVFGETKVEERGGDAFYVKFNKDDLEGALDAYGPFVHSKIQGDVPGREHRVDTIYVITKNP